MKEITIELEKDNSYGYYVLIWFGKNEYYTSDKEISNLLGMTLNTYHNLILSQFECKIHDIKYGHIYDNDILIKELYFDKKDIGEEFRKWLKDNIDNYLVMKELNPDMLIGE